MRRGPRATDRDERIIVDDELLELFADDQHSIKWIMTIHRWLVAKHGGLTESRCAGLRRSPDPPDKDRT